MHNSFIFFPQHLQQETLHTIQLHLSSSPLHHRSAMHGNCKTLLHLHHKTPRSISSLPIPIPFHRRSNVLTLTRGGSRSESDSGSRGMNCKNIKIPSARSAEMDKDCQAIPCSLPNQKTLTGRLKEAVGEAGWVGAPFLASSHPLIIIFDLQLKNGDQFLINFYHSRHLKGEAMKFLWGRARLNFPGLG